MNTEQVKMRNKMKHKQKYASEKTPLKRTSYTKPITKLCLTIILTLATLIVLKTNPKYKATFYQQVYDNHISFATINDTYQKYFGSPLPFKDLFQTNTEPVFQETLKYKEQHKYKDGVELVVDSNYLVPILESGMVVFIGEKEGYGNTVIVQQMDGIDTWYSNLKTINVKLYDYVEKGSLLGEVNQDRLYLVYKKNGTVLNYEERI